MDTKAQRMHGLMNDEQLEHTVMQATQWDSHKDNNKARIGPPRGGNL